MAGATPGINSTAIPRVAAQLSRCFRTGFVPAEVADPLRSCFPEALLLSVSIPSVGVEDDLLISLGNFLETGFPKVTLAALRTSAAGKCYRSNTPVESPPTAEQPGREARFSDAEAAREGSNTEVLLCSPIPHSTASVLARSNSTFDPSDLSAGCLGTVTLGLRGVSSSIDRYKEDLHKLALMLAETIQRDSRGLVVDVCKYQLGGSGPWPEEEPLGSLDLSTSCSEEGGRYSSGSGGPPEGGLPQLVEDVGEKQGQGDESADQGHKEQEDWHRSEEGGDSREGGGSGTDPGGRDQRRAGPQHEEGERGSQDGAMGESRKEPGDSQRKGGDKHHDNDVHSKKATPASGKARLRRDDTAMRRSFRNGAQLPDYSSERQVSDEEARADRRADLQLRAEMIDTYDAKAAGCTASAFEEQSHNPRNGRRPSSDSAGEAGTGCMLQECCSDQNRHSSLLSSGSGRCNSGNQSCAQNGARNLPAGSSGNGLHDAGERSGACAGALAMGKAGTQKPQRHSLARLPLLAYKEPCLERAYTLWHARHRWQVDAVGFVAMTYLSARSAVALSEQAQAPWQSAALASCQHVLPLLIMALSLPWYLRNRELVLATYLVLSAAVTSYRAHRETLPLEPQSALASLFWFSRAQSAEPLMLKSIIFALRFRMVVFVQGLCILVAASRAAHVCAACCSAAMSPTFCLLKAWATQAMFGCGVPAAVFYFTEDTFRQIFEEQHLRDS